MNKITKLVALSSLVATTAFAEHSRARAQVQTNLFGLTQRLATLGVQAHVYSHLSMEIDAIFSIQGMIKEKDMTGLNFFHGMNVNFLWYTNACAKDGFFGRLGVSYVNAKNGEWTTKFTEDSTTPTVHNLSLSFGIGHRYDLGYGFAVSNTLFVQKKFYTSKKHDDNVLESNWDHEARSGNLMTEPSLAGNLFLDGLRFEVLKLSYSVY